MRISVAMAAYQGEAYIGSQLDSILRELPENAQVVISDGGSLDDTLPVVCGYARKDARIKVLPVPAHRLGVVQNFERALTACEGDVVFLSDQDDVWLPGKVSMMLAKMRETGAQVCVCNARIADQNLNQSGGTTFQALRAPAGPLSNLLRNRFMGCAMAFTGRVLKDALPFPKKIAMHDQWIGLIGQLRGGAAWVETPLMLYRRHENTVTGKGAAPLAVRLSRRAYMAFAVARRIGRISLDGRSRKGARI